MFHYLYYPLHLRSNEPLPFGCFICQEPSGPFSPRLILYLFQLIFILIDEPIQFQADTA